MKNEKGFTLVELLVSITILGIILAIALPQLTSLQQDNKDTKYKKYAESVITSAKLYTDSYHKDMFGNNSSGCYDIPYSKLEDKSLVKDINVDGATCNTYAADGVTSLTYVRVYKSNENYLYDIAIKCNDKNGKEVYKEVLNGDVCDGTRTDTDGPTITIEKVDNWTTGKDALGNPLKAKVKISDSFGLKENVKVEYAWTKTPDNLSSLSFTQKAFKNSREDLVQNLSFQVNYPQNENGEWYLIVRPVGDEGLRDANGNYYSDGYTKSTPVLLDNTKPEITNTTNNSSGNWIKGTAIVTATAKDDHSGLKSVKYTYNKDGKSSLKSDWKTGITPGTKGPVTVTKEWTTELNQTIYIVAEDRVGNKSIVKNSGSVKLDNTGPTCAVSNGSATWINKTSTTKSRTITATCTDAGSGCKIETFSHTYSTDIDTTTAGAAGDNNGGSFEDNVGNVTQCVANKIVKIDKTAPSIPKITNGSGGKLTNQNFSLTLTSSDSLSGIGAYQYTYKQGATAVGSNSSAEYVQYANSNSTSFTTTPFSAERNQPVYIRACDNAGNCSEPASTQINIDKTAPTCTVTKSNTNTSSGVTATYACSTDTTNCPAQDTGLISSKETDITDAAGNTGKCSVTVSSKTLYRTKSSYCARYKRAKACGCASGSLYSCPSGYPAYCDANNTNCTNCCTSGHVCIPDPSPYCMTYARCAAAGCEEKGWSYSDYSDTASCSNKTDCTIEDLLVYY